MSKYSKWLPTRKWWFATTVAVGTILGLVLTGDGINSDDETIAVIGLVVQRVGSYIIPND